MILGYQNFSCLSLIYSRFFFRHVDDGEIQQVFHPIFLAYRMLNTVYRLDSRLDFSVFNFLLDLPLTRDTDTKTIWAILQNFNSWMMKFIVEQKKPFGTGQFGKFEVLFFKNWSFSKLFFLQFSFSRERKIWEDWEKN